MVFTRDYTTTAERLKPVLRFYFYTSENEYDITEMIEGHTWGGDINTAHESLEFEVYNKQLKGNERELLFAEGGMVKVMLEPKVSGWVEELYRGIIIKRQVTAKGKETVSSVDYNWYLQQNQVTASFSGVTASQICRQLCQMADIESGHIADTGHRFGELEFIEKSIWEIIRVVLTETYLSTGKHYITQSEGGKFALREVVMSNKRMLVERGYNMLDATRSTSIENVKTKVTAIIDNEGESATATRSDSAAMKKYGTLAAIIKVDEGVSVESEAQTLLDELKEMEDSLSVEALADYTVSKGTVIESYDTVTGANDYYFVTAHTHTNAKTMSLTLSKTYDTELVPYEDPSDDSDEEGGSGSGSGSGVEKTSLTGVTYTDGFIATAYDPNLGGINGSGDYSTTASGTKWAYGRTIAVDPSVIPYGSVVHILVEGMPQYNGLYLAEDTGGAIKGKRIDMLIKGKEATSQFGRRNAQVAIVNRGGGRNDARDKAGKWDSVKSDTLSKFKPETTKATGKAGDVVSTAQSFIGKVDYVFGGKTIVDGTGDCSGFTYYVYKQAGINIGHGTTSQVTKGTKIAKSAAKAGDLVFFKGTYRSGVSHVGIVTRPGYCISLADSGVTEHSYETGYWGGKFMQINRVL